jgi:endo-1,3-1,4-beta-glycanase ExoK
MKALVALFGVLTAALLSGCNEAPPEDDTGSGGGGQASSKGGSGGATATGGTGTSVGGMSPVSASFELLWEDTFDTFDVNRWEKRDHTFAENASAFSPDNALVEGGFLKLKITTQPRDGKPYSAAEIRTKEDFLYGRFEARLKPARGSGIVSSLFTYLYGPWNEIDIEYLGNQQTGVQYNLITDGPGGLEYQPHFDSLDFIPWEDFHVYAFEWTPTLVKFFVDGVQTYADPVNVAERLTNPVRLHVNCWPTNNEATQFAGTLDPSAIPTEAQYDWVRVYRYVP